MVEYFGSLTHASWYRVMTLRCYCGAIVENDGPPIVCPKCGSAFVFTHSGPTTEVTGIDSAGNPETN